ncbi:F-box protein At4g00755-like isoform X3 [Prosopis cineraria]|uniref:F-box protein At4g00755-like isoform X2 n=1 Tax=Prosopis cineraria TaxID=364024 RepID=UPI0024103ED8|nr:F-box protein At4g00755-like isoform X2 [Prosopis cineraria]XP_054786309.1 F-box protein At4g00755-like isoform X3 [Prosopis cineraria]
MTLIIGSMSEVENNGDFIRWLGPDLSIKILAHLDDPCDIARVAAVSSAWHRFVVENGLGKQLCLKMFPELSVAAHVIEVDNTIEPIGYVPGNPMTEDYLKRNHKVYAFLACGLAPYMRKNCIAEAIVASSTDNYPEESIENTMEPRDRTEIRASYWSSKGESDPSVPETLVYKLISKICVVTEIHVQPFQAYFQNGHPIYSAKSVRFRMGYLRQPKELESNRDAKRIFRGKDFVWTYTSPEFPMAQENRLQKFKLPEPVFCVGGMLLVELLGRAQKQRLDELYYICISHVKVLGRPLSSGFSAKIHHSGRCFLKYSPQADSYFISPPPDSSQVPFSLPSSGLSNSPSRLRALTYNIMQRAGRRFWGGL